MTYKRPMIHVVPKRPVLTPGQQDFQVARPLETHWEAATCKDRDCRHYLNGWVTIVPTDSPQAGYIRHMSGRDFTEKKIDDGLVEFTFQPGQKCFNEHEAPDELRREPHIKQLDKQEIFIHRSPDGFRVHDRPLDWTEHMNIEVDKVERKRKEG